MGLSPDSRFKFDFIKPTKIVSWTQALLNFTQFNLHYRRLQNPYLEIRLIVKKELIKWNCLS